jgi:two-component system cell cycle response regulator
MSSDQLSKPSPQVLVACSDAAETDRIVEALSAWRYPVLTTADGAAAVRLMTGHMPPEIALLDAELPGLTAVEVAAKVQPNKRKRAPWMILMSSRVDANVGVSATDAGLDDLLLKPVDLDQLRVRLMVAQRLQLLQKEIDEKAHALRFQASHDHLTGLWDRASIMGLLLQETARVQRMGTPMALLMMDLDDFARINTEYGYETGDAVLQELANRFRSHLRNYDLIGRMGADEFLLALPGCDAEQAGAIVQRLTSLVADKPFKGCGGETVRLSASIGVAQSLGRSPLVVLRAAEDALAEAKKNRRNAGGIFEQAEGALASAIHPN